MKIIHYYSILFTGVLRYPGAVSFVRVFFAAEHTNRLGGYVVLTAPAGFEFAVRPNDECATFPVEAAPYAETAAQPAFVEGACVATPHPTETATESTPRNQALRYLLLCSRSLETFRYIFSISCFFCNSI